ncbi:hypothetical protein BGG37_07495, partial [Campylobacter lari]|nr:hypothetical protein [Campylobacter lari]
MNKKHLAIHLSGHFRTFEQTYHSFYKYVIDINKKDYDIDIFIHAWNKLQEYNDTEWHKAFDYYPTMNNVDLDDGYIAKIKKIYNPIAMDIQKLPHGKHGWLQARQTVYKIRKEYEIEKKITYDAYLYTRPDIMFFKPLHILAYIEFWKKLPNMDGEILWSAHSSFSRMPIADPRCVTENDLIYFTKFSDMFSPQPTLGTFVNIAIDYLLHRDFEIWREVNPKTESQHLIYIRKKILIEKDIKIESLTNDIISLSNQLTKLKNLQENITHKKQLLEVQNLEQDLNLKSLQTKEVQENIDLKTLEKTKLQKELEQYNNIVYV